MAVNANYEIRRSARGLRPELSQEGYVNLVLVRHGESIWNAAGIVQGQQGPGLTQTGAEQARITAKHLLSHYPTPVAVIRSDLPRVAETAEPFEAMVGLEPTMDQRWREIDKGEWSGMPRAQVEAAAPAQMAAIRRGEDVRRGGGETVGELRERVATALDDAVRLGVEGSSGMGGTVLVFSHRGPIRIAVAVALGLAGGEHRRLRHPAQCSLSVLEYATEPHAPARLAAYNRVDHMKGAGLENLRMEIDDE